jgi:hypothetical protein
MAKKRTRPTPDPRSVDRARAKRGSGQANQEPDDALYGCAVAGMPVRSKTLPRLARTPRPARGSNLAPYAPRAE